MLGIKIWEHIGCDGNFADPSSLKRYAFAQQMVWECLGQSSATFVDSSVQNEYVTFRNETNNKIAKMGQRASFDGSTITIRQGEVTTATDTNDVLKDYESIDVTESGVHIRHNKGDNFMTFSVNDDCNIETLRISDSKFQEWGLIKSGTQDKRTTVYISFENDVQDQLFAMDYNDPVTLSLSLAIEAKGRLELIKTNDNRDLIDGSTFRVTGPNNYNERVTVTGGKIVIEDLIKGIYTITEESTKDSYLLNTETYTVEIKPNETATKTIVNKEPTGTITVEKRNMNGDKLGAGFVFKITAAEDIYNAERTVKHYSKGDIVGRITTANSGVATKTGLPMRKLFSK